MTRKQRVRQRYRNAGAQLSAMHGWQIVDYGKDGTGTTVLGSSGKNETMAWSNADARLRRLDVGAAGRKP